MYGKGQFFLPHQDSEKGDTMIGTLVVSLPSSHAGGELVIEHNGKAVTYRASADEVPVAAFYAELRARLEAGDLAGARAGAESAAPFWQPFAVGWVTPAHADGLAALAARYDESWHQNLLDAWFGTRNAWRHTGDVDRGSRAGALPGLTAALRGAGAEATAGWPARS